MPLVKRPRPFLRPALDRVRRAQAAEAEAARGVWRDLWVLLVRIALIILALPIRRPVRPVIPPRTYVVLADPKNWETYIAGVRPKDRPFQFPALKRHQVLGVIPREGDQVLVMDFPLRVDPYVREWLKKWCGRARVTYRHSDWESLV